MFGNKNDLAERLEFVRSHSNRPVGFLFGSGLSNSVLPTTQELTSLMIGQTSQAAQAKFISSDLGRAGGAVAYQDAARILSLHQGDEQVARVIRNAVLQACESWDGNPDLDEAEIRDLVKSGSWNVPDGYLRFAEYFAGLDDSMRGTLSTTNFDPFLELALRQAGVLADPVSLSFDNPPATSSIAEMSAIPVVHLHGYFGAGYSLNTLRQLSHARINTEEFLRKLYAGSSIVVLGYGGWDDVFTRVLTRHAAQQTLANAEVVWAVHNADEQFVSQNSVLAQLVGQPGVQIYLGIDGDQLFRGASVDRSRAQDYVLPRAYRLLPAGFDEIEHPTEFTEGAQPTWSDTLPGTWPQLAATRRLKSKLDTAIAARSGLLVAIGPMGEGKSTAIRQLAQEVASQREDIVAIWREPAAPALDLTIIDSISESKTVLICIDDADLAQLDLQALSQRWRAQGSGVVVLAACQDRLWTAMPSAISAHSITELFEGISEQDASAIGRKWAQLDAGPGVKLAEAELNSRAEVFAVNLITAASETQESRGTLFGAILDVREGASLKLRIADLMRSLDGTRVSNRNTTTLADIFGSICLLQHSMDAGEGRNGATRSHISRLAMSADVLASERVLITLGREASLAFSGARVYARHPRIAALVVDWMRAEGRLVRVTEMTGFAGGELRQDSLVTVDNYDSYMLWKSIDDAELSMAAARGAVKGASRLLESRINLMAAARQHGRVEWASEYGRGIASALSTYDDRYPAFRIFVNELALDALGAGEALISAGLAALSIHDHSGNALSKKNLSFSFSSLSKSLATLIRQKNTAATEPARSLMEFLDQTRDFTYAQRLLETTGVQRDQKLSGISLGALSSRLATQLTPFAKEAVAELDLPVGIPGKDVWRIRFGGRLEFSGLADTV